MTRSPDQSAPARRRRGVTDPIEPLRRDLRDSLLRQREALAYLRRRGEAADAGQLELFADSELPIPSH